mgnify:CR=1 FL=1|tara:strand:- start:43431 stop:43811 length:381 start_codon:yes stop_codon:yes gene_type:complete
MSVRGVISKKRLKRLLRIMDAFAAGESRPSVRKRMRLSDFSMADDMQLLREHTREQLEEMLAIRTGKRVRVPVKTCVYLVRKGGHFVPCGKEGGQYCRDHNQATRPLANGGRSISVRALIGAGGRL